MSLPQVSAPRGTTTWSLSQQQPVMQAVCCRAIRGLSNYMFHEATRMAKVALHNLPSEPCCALTGTAVEGSHPLCSPCSPWAACRSLRPVPETSMTADEHGWDRYACSAGACWLWVVCGTHSRGSLQHGSRPKQCSHLAAELRPCSAGVSSFQAGLPPLCHRAHSGSRSAPTSGR